MTRENQKLRADLAARPRAGSVGRRRRPAARPDERARRRGDCACRPARRPRFADPRRTRGARRRRARNLPGPSALPTAFARFRQPHRRQPDRAASASRCRAIADAAATFRLSKPEAIAMRAVSMRDSNASGSPSPSVPEHERHAILPFERADIGFCRAATAQRAESHAVRAARESRRYARIWRREPERHRPPTPGSPCGRAGRSRPRRGNTASAPKAAALRKIEPTLSWFDMPASTSTSARGGNPSNSSVAAGAVPPSAQRQNAAMNVKARRSRR